MTAAERDRFLGYWDAVAVPGDQESLAELTPEGSLPAMPAGILVYKKKAQALCQLLGNLLAIAHHEDIAGFLFLRKHAAAHKIKVD